MCGSYHREISEFHSPRELSEVFVPAGSGENPGRKIWTISPVAIRVI